MWNDFKKFAARGSVIDLAVGVIIGAAFGKIVSSLVNDIVMPPIGLLIGRIDFRNLFVPLNGQHYASLADAQKAAAPTINYGLFINACIEFLIVALVIFMIVRQINKLQAAPPTAPAEPPRNCPYCFSRVPLKATRCPFCTSAIPGVNLEP